MNKYIFRLSFILLSVIILLASAIYMFPLPDGDAIFFMPTAWFYANNKGFINPLVELACKTDPKGLCRYCFHLPLFPWILGVIAKINPSVQTVFIASTIFSVSKLWLFDNVLHARFKNLKSYVFLYPSALLLLAFYSLPTTGRPELLSSLLILFIYALSLEKSVVFSPRYTVLLVGTLGLLFSCQLTGYYFTIILLALTLILRKGTVFNKILYITLLAILSFLVGLFIIWLSPNGLDTIQGMLSHNPLGRVDELSYLWYVFYWLAHPSYPAIGFFLLVCIYLYVLSINNKIKNIVDLFEKKLIYSFVALSFVLLLMGFYKFYVKTPDRVYDLSQFFPVFIIYIISRFNLFDYRKRIIFNLCLFVVLLLPFRTIVLFFDYLIDQKTYATATEVFCEKFGKQERIIGSRPLWVLCDDLTRFTEWQGDTINDPLFIVQARRPLPEIVEKDGVLVYDWRTIPLRRVLFIPISNRPQGYSFSVWQLRQK